MTPMELPEEEEDIRCKLLPILKVVYQARSMMEKSNLLVRRSTSIASFGLAFMTLENPKNEKEMIVHLKNNL
jgi:hypothetical protein